MKKMMQVFFEGFLTHGITFTDNNGSIISR